MGNTAGRKTRMGGMAFWLLVPVLWLAGCSGSADAYRIPLELTVKVELPAAAMTAGEKLRVVVYRVRMAPYIAESDRLEPVDEYETGLLPQMHKLEFPASAQDRLAVWVWADTDGDGRFCGQPGVMEPAGFVLSEPFPGAGQKPVREFARMPGNSLVAHQFADPVTLEVRLAGTCATASQLAARVDGKHAG